MAIGVKPLAVNDFTGNQIILQEVDGSSFAASAPAAGTTTVNVGLIKNSRSAKVPTTTKYPSEDGEIYVKPSYSFEKLTTGILQQRDKDLFDFMAETVTTKTYLQIKRQTKTGTTVDGKHQWLFMIGNVTPQFDVTSPGAEGSMPYEFIAIKPSAAVSYASTVMASIAALMSLTNFVTAGITIPVAGYLLEEVS